MIRGRTRRTGELDFYDDEAPATVVGSVTAAGITGAVGGSVTSAGITDATATGKAVLTAASTAAARTAIGAGTSSLAIGTTGTTAAAGNDARLLTGTVTAINTAVTFADLTAATTAYNALLTALRARGVISGS